MTTLDSDEPFLFNSVIMLPAISYKQRILMNYIELAEEKPQGKVKGQRMDMSRITIR